MGRSTASCFKIITCGSESLDNDEVEASESKSSGDKRGWSFRKRSASHRVLSNTVTSDKPSFNKESSETDDVNLQSQSNMNFLGKTSAIPLMDDRPQLSAATDLKVSDSGVISEDNKKCDDNPDESVIVVIQASIRGFLAQREMLKLKNVIKLQAAVRGHLVRRQAVGTLRCIQTIIKMQALIRARYACLSSEGLYTERKLDENYTKDNRSSNHLRNSLAVPNEMHKSIEKLLSNKFASQLLESTPRNKHINIKCDPYGSDSTWDWLEKWMSVLSIEVQQPVEPGSTVKMQKQDKVEFSSTLVETQLPSDSSESTDLKANVSETVISSKSEENFVSHDADNFDFQACNATSSSKIGNLEPPQPDDSGTSEPKENLLNLLPNQLKQSESVSKMEIQSNTVKPEMDDEKPACSVKRIAPEQVGTETKMFVSGTGRLTNPAFIAVKSKFEELSSSANPVRSTRIQNQDDGVESNSDSISSTVQNLVKKEEIGLADHSVLPIPIAKVGGSECGTELSISSTLDSLDSSEVGVMDARQDADPSEEGNSTLNFDIKANDKDITPETDLSYSMSMQPEKLDHVDDEHSVSAKAADSLVEKQEAETTASNMQIKQEETGHAYKSSLEASPRSCHMAVPESQRTPSSQVSVKAERTKSERGSSDKKRRSLSSGKKSPSNPKQESGVRNSLEQLPKDHKSGKRRNSLGSGRSDSVDQEAKDGDSGNPLPNYMQATESARAKAIANSSPRSSPDVQKDIYVKKRLSLPSANGKQGSPRVQQGAKGNGHLHEKKWQR
ncbi:hypothetical protein NMG60_11016166 [Bertholletia excelsa]